MDATSTAASTLQSRQRRSCHSTAAIRGRDPRRDTFACAANSVAAPGYAAVTGYSTLLWTVAALTVAAAALGWRSEHAAP
jgi:hypothetical protein